MENTFQEPNILFVCLMGIGIVFLGLICIILLCELMGAIFRNLKNSPAEPVPVAAPVAAPATTADIPNRQAFIAAVSAAIAEDLGTDVSAISILSIKKL